MAIRPKVGDRVGLNGWQIVNGAQPPPMNQWTGEVVRIERLHYCRHNWYHVKRDADGEVVTLLSSEMYRLCKICGGKGWITVSRPKATPIGTVTLEGACPACNPGGEKRPPKDG